VSKTSFTPIGTPISGRLANVAAGSLSSSRARSIASSPGSVAKAPIAPSSLRIAMLAAAATSTQLSSRARTSATMSTASRSLYGFAALGTRAAYVLTQGPERPQPRATVLPASSTMRRRDSVGRLASQART